LAHVLCQIVKPCLHETASRAPQDRFPLPTVQPVGLPQISFKPGNVAPDCGPRVLQPFDVHDRTAFLPAVHRLDRIARVGFVFTGEDDPGGLVAGVRRCGFVVRGAGRTSCRSTAGSSSSAPDRNRRRKDSNEPHAPPPAAA
jgi:hypothetical protein